MKAIIYLLQVTACTGIFYAFYFLLLRRYTFFTLNRWYLLGTLLLSFIIPAITIPVHELPQTPAMQPVIYVQQMQIIAEPVIKAVPRNAVPVQDVNWLGIIKVTYISLVIALLLRLLFVLLLFVLRTRTEKLMQVGNIQVLKAVGNYTNSSFFNIVFINTDTLTPDEVKQILNHELLHVKLLHSADRLIAWLAQIVLWFNPFMYAYLRSIEENHEFEVDRIASKGADKGAYATLLFKLSVSGQSSLFQSFSKAPLKTRVAMLFNKPTSNMKKMIYVLMLPVVVVSCLAFAKFKSNNSSGKRLSAVVDLSYLGRHPLVVVDEKVYNDDILYKISNSCIAGTSLMLPAVSSKMFGNKAKDGYVKITTKHHTIKYLTAFESENLEKVAELSAGRFYSRIKLKNNDGSDYEKVIIKWPNSTAKVSSTIKTGGKVIFFVNGKLFTEKEIDQVEQFAKTHKLVSCGVGPVSQGKKSAGLTLNDQSNHDVQFDITADKDTAKYRQKVRGTSKEVYLESVRQREAYVQTDDYKYKSKAMLNAMSSTLKKYKVIALLDSMHQSKRITGYKLSQGEFQYVLTTMYGQNKQLIGQLQVGDEIDMKAYNGVYGKDTPLQIEPATIVKNGIKIFELAEAKPIPQYPFLYEANRVRFTDGQVTNIVKYPNGKWKSAVVEVVNGYKIKINIKLSAPEFKEIEWGDHVRFRFVHEVKTAQKEYTVSDWVSLTTDIKDYGIKNPDLFPRFYEKI